MPGDFDAAAHDSTFRTYLWDFRHYLNRMPHIADADAASLEELTALYLGATAWVDDTLATVLRTLDATGQTDKTLAVFTSDHGDMLASHNLFGKGTLHEESYRIPMMIEGCGVKSGHVDSGVGSLIDVAPTFLTAAGVDVPEYMGGVAMNNRLAGDSGEGTSCIIEQVGETHIGRRTATTLEILDRKGHSHRTWDLAVDPLQQDADGAERNGLPDDVRNELRAWDDATEFAAAKA